MELQNCSGVGGCWGTKRLVPREPPTAFGQVPLAKNAQLLLPRVTIPSGCREGPAQRARLSACVRVCGSRMELGPAPGRPAGSRLETDSAGSRGRKVPEGARLLTDPWFLFDRIPLCLGNSYKDLRHCPASPET